MPSGPPTPSGPLSVRSATFAGVTSPPDLPAGRPETGLGGSSGQAIRPASSSRADDTASSSRSSDSVEWGWTDTSARGHGLLADAVRSMISDGDGALLDVGCGAGALTHVCHQLGWDATGVDVSADGLALARASFPGVRFAEGSAYDDLTVFAPPGGFDVVLSSEVIEHLYRPALLLERSYAALRPGGRLLVTTPYHGYLFNIALSVANRWDTRFDVHRDGWHIKFFSRRTLTDMVVGAGFEVIEWRGLGRLPWLWWSQALLACKPDEVSP